MKDDTVSFLHDRWFGFEPLCKQKQVTELPCLKLADCKSVMGWNVDLFTRLVGHEKIEELIEQLGSVKTSRSVNLVAKF